MHYLTKNSHLSNFKLIVVLLCILPIIDSLNGMFRGLPIGKVYKLSLGLIIFANILLQKRKLKKSYFLTLGVGAGIIFLSMAINLLLGTLVGNIEYPVKFFFNLLLGVSLFQSIEYKLITKDEIYKVLNFSSWFFILCYLIPYILGVGNAVYVGSMGYKAFFIAQNELGLIIVVFAFFTVFQLSRNIEMINMIKLACLFLCGLLLNTKTAILACAIAIALWIVPIIINGNIKIKIISILALSAGVFLLRDSFFSAVLNSYDRYNYLASKYGDSVTSGLLSGRDILFANAWNAFIESNPILHIIIGNGFCSELLVEMDFIDIFFYLGLIGLGYVLFLFINLIKRTIINTKNDRNRIRLLSLFIIIGHMFFAGHVLFMSMSGCFFVIYLSFLIYYSDFDIQRK